MKATQYEHKPSCLRRCHDVCRSGIASAVSYKHIFTPSLLGALRGTVRDIAATLWLNPNSTPIAASQDRGYRQGHLNGSLAGQNGAHDWKVGAEARWASINERFNYQTPGAG